MWDLKSVKSKEKFEISGESKNGRFLETYYSENTTRERAKELMDDLVDAVDSGFESIGSITIRKSPNEE